jgi:hypothetical protein
MITIRPRQIKSQDSWESKIQGVLFVEKEKDIETLWILLCEQDDYWEDYKHLIKVAPKEIDNEEDLKKYCQYVGKTDIWNVKELQQKIDFIIFQYYEQYYY